MNKLVMMLVVLFTTLFATSVLAFTPPSAPPNGGYVVDQAGKMSSSQIQKLNQKIEQISKSTKNEFGILLLPTMDGDNIEDVANSTFKAWGVGKRGLDNGCLIVVSVKERKSRIETGKGVGGEVPDLQAHDILLKNLNPHLKSGDFYGGFNSTLDALSSFIESRHNQKADPPPVVANPPTPVQSKSDTSDTPTRRPSSACSVSATGSNSFGDWGTTVLIVGAFGVITWLWVRRAKRLAKDAAEQERQVKELERKAKRALVQLQQEEAQRKQLKAFLKAEQQKNEQILAESLPKAPPQELIEKVAALKPVSFPLPPAKPKVPRPTHKKQQNVHKEHVADVITAASAASVTAAAQALQDKLRREAREAAEAAARKARKKLNDEAEEARRKRQQAEDDNRSSYRSSSSSSSSDSSSSFDWGGGSSSGSDSGGFGGGDSGGGGSSSDW